MGDLAGEGERVGDPEGGDAGLDGEDEVHELAEPEEEIWVRGGAEVVEISICGVDEGTIDAGGAQAFHAVEERSAR